MGEKLTRKIRVSLTRFVWADFLALNSPSLVITVSPFLLISGGHLLHGGFTTCFKEGQGRRGQSDLPISPTQPLCCCLDTLICMCVINVAKNNAMKFALGSEFSLRAI